MKAILLVSILCCSFIITAQNKNPNIVVVLADDIGLGDVSGYRRAHSNNIIVETPQLDQLMKEGIHFTDAHSPTALCAPSRYSVMTGNNSYHSYAPWGVWGSYEESPIKKTDLTLGKLLKKAGYQTAFFGKWHLGGDWYRKGSTTEVYRGPRWKIQTEVDITQIKGAGPRQNGFDYSFMLPSGIQDVPYAAYENGKWYPFKETSKIGLITKKKASKINVKLDKDEGLGDTEWNPFQIGPLLAEKAVNFINTTASDHPFFMYYCTQAVHKPHTPTDQFNGKKVKGSTPSYHLDMVKEMDLQIQSLVNALKKKGVYDNTVFIFTSDNGGLSFVKKTRESGHKSSDIYRGQKNSIYEGGHRVPFIVVWPRKIKSNTMSDITISGTDILATLAAITKQNLPKDQAMDSSNLLPILLEKTGSLDRKGLLIQGGTTKKVAYREGDWKLIIQYKKEKDPIPVSLYNLKNSPKENEDLITLPEYQDKIEYMFGAYFKIRSNKMATKSLSN